MQASLGVDVTFASGTGDLLGIGAKASVAGTIAGFGNGDVINVGRSTTSLTFIGNTLTLYHGSTAVETLAFAGDYTAADFHLASDGRGGTDILFGAEMTTPAHNSIILPAVERLVLPLLADAESIRKSGWAYMHDAHIALHPVLAT